MIATLALPPLVNVALVLGALVLIGLFSWWLWRTPYVPPPTVHRDYRREGDPPEEADRDEPKK